MPQVTTGKLRASGGASAESPSSAGSPGSAESPKSGDALADALAARHASGSSVAYVMAMLQEENECMHAIIRRREEIENYEKLKQAQNNLKQDFAQNVLKASRQGPRSNRGALQR